MWRIESEGIISYFLQHVNFHIWIYDQSCRHVGHVRQKEKGGKERSLDICMAWWCSSRHILYVASGNCGVYNIAHLEISLRNWIRCYITHRKSLLSSPLPSYLSPLVFLPTPNSHYFPTIFEYISLLNIYIYYAFISSLWLWVRSLKFWRIFQLYFLNFLSSSSALLCYLLSLNINM